MTFEILIGWILIGAILGAFVAPRQDWSPGVGALIGGTFGLFGVLFLLVVRAPRPRTNPEWDKLADDLEAYKAAGEPPVDELRRGPR